MVVINVMSLIGCGDSRVPNATATASLNQTETTQQEEQNEDANVQNEGNCNEDRNKDGGGAGVGADVESKNVAWDTNKSKGQTEYIYAKAEPTDAPAHLRTELLRFENHRPIEQRVSWMESTFGFDVNKNVDSKIPVHRGYQAPRVSTLNGAPLKPRARTSEMINRDAGPMNPSLRDQPIERKPAIQVVHREADWSQNKKATQVVKPQDTTYVAAKASQQLNYNDAPVMPRKKPAPLPAISREKSYPAHAVATLVTVAPRQKRLGLLEQIRQEFERPRVEKQYGARVDNGNIYEDFKEYFNTSAHTQDHVEHYKNTHKVKSKFSLLDELGTMVTTNHKDYPANIMKRQSKENANSTRVIDPKTGEYKVVNQNERMRHYEEDQKHWGAKSGIGDEIAAITKMVGHSTLSGGTKGYMQPAEYQRSSSTGHSRLGLTAEVQQLAAAAWKGQANHETLVNNQENISATGTRPKNKYGVGVTVEREGEEWGDQKTGQEAASAAKRVVSKDTALHGSLSAAIAEMSHRVPGAHRDDDKASVWDNTFETHKENWQVNIRDSHRGLGEALAEDASILMGTTFGVGGKNGAIIDRHTGIEVAAMKAPPPEMRDATYYDPETDAFDARSSTMHHHHDIEEHVTHAVGEEDGWHGAYSTGVNRADDADVLGVDAPEAQGNCSIM